MSELTPHERMAYRRIMRNLFHDSSVELVNFTAGVRVRGADLHSALSNMCDKIAESAVGTAFFLEPV